MLKSSYLYLLLEETLWISSKHDYFRKALIDVCVSILMNIWGMWFKFSLSINHQKRRDKRNRCGRSLVECSEDANQSLRIRVGVVVRRGGTRNARLLGSFHHRCLRACDLNTGNDLCPALLPLERKPWPQNFQTVLIFILNRLGWT